MPYSRIRSTIIHFLAKECCINCKHRGDHGKYVELYYKDKDGYPLYSTWGVSGYKCTKNGNYLHKELDKCKFWEREQLGTSSS